MLVQIWSCPCRSLQKNYCPELYLTTTGPSRGKRGKRLGEILWVSSWLYFDITPNPSIREWVKRFKGSVCLVTYLQPGSNHTVTIYLNFLIDSIHLNRNDILICTCHWWLLQTPIYNSAHFSEEKNTLFNIWLVYIILIRVWKNLSKTSVCCRYLKIIKTILLNAKQQMG